jgi:hypothetical protein
MTYSARVAVLHIINAARIDLTDDEVVQLLTESIDSIEEHGRAVREAAQRYEMHVVKLAAEMIGRRLASGRSTNEMMSRRETADQTTAPVEACRESSQRSN